MRSTRGHGESARFIIVRRVARGVGETSARVVEAPDAGAALAWMQQDPGGAIAFMVMSAIGCDVRVTPSADADARLAAALARATEAGALRALAWQATGVVREGEAMTIVAASAASRKVANSALALLQDGLRGVATREDLR